MLYHAKALLHHAFLWENINYDTLKYFRVKCYNDVFRALADLYLCVLKKHHQGIPSAIAEDGIYSILSNCAKKSRAYFWRRCWDRASISVFSGCVKKYQQAFLAPLPGKALE